MFDNIAYAVHYESGAFGNFLAAVIRNHVLGYDIVLNHWNNAHWSRVDRNYTKEDWMDGYTGLKLAAQKRKFKNRYAIWDHIEPINNSPVIIAEHHTVGRARWEEIKQKWPKLEVMIVTVTGQDLWQAAGNWLAKTKVDLTGYDKHENRAFWKGQPVDDYHENYPKIKSIDDITPKLIYCACKFRVRQHKLELGYGTDNFPFNPTNSYLQHDFIHFMPFRLMYTDPLAAMDIFCDTLKIPKTESLKEIWIKYMDNNIALAKRWMPWLDPVNGNFIDNELEKII